MPTLNRVFLIGRLTRPPECRYTAGGTAVGTFGIALSRHWKTAAGEEKEDVCFITVEAIGAPAEKARSQFTKGALVYVEGRLRMDVWQDRRSGRQKKRLKVSAENLELL